MLFYCWKFNKNQPKNRDFKIKPLDGKTCFVTEL